AIVQEAVKAIAMSCDEIGRANRLFAALRELFEPLRSQGPAALEFGGVALHPGALAAYREVGLLTGTAAPPRESGHARLLRLDPCLLDHLAPQGGFFGKEAGGLGRRSRAGRERDPAQHLDHLVAVENFDHIAIDLFG